MPISGILEQHVETGLIIEETIEINNIRMIQIELDFKLPSKLMIYFLLDDCLFLNYFQCTDEPSLDILHQVDITKFAFAQFFPYFKIAEFHS